MKTEQQLEEKYYSFTWNFDDEGRLLKHLNIKAKASKKTITLENKLEPYETGFEITVPTELFILKGDEWKKHPIVFFRYNDRGCGKDIIVILKDGKHSFTNYTSKQEPFYNEAKRLGLT